MLQHYVDLLKSFWLRILAGSIVAGALTCALSLLLLFKSPSYTASVTMNMQPSEQALTFNREFLGVSQFNPATIISQTHIERLLSRPVVERTLDTLLAEAGEIETEEPTGLAAVRLWVWKTWTRLNYGGYIELPERDQMINLLLGTLEVEAVEGSYILRLSSTFEYPDFAARIANVHAESYLQIATEEVSAKTTDNATVIRDRLQERQQELDGVFTQLSALREDYAIADLRTESEVLIETLQEAQTTVADEELELILLRNTLQQLMESVSGNTRVTQGPIAEAEASIDELSRRIQFRKEKVGEYQRQLAILGKREAEFEDLQIESRALQADLGQLREQLMQFELGSRTQASQVQIMSPAVVPVYPSSPKVLVNTVAALITGALLVLLGIVMQDLIGTRIRTEFDLKNEVGSRALPTASTSLINRSGLFAGLRRRARRRRLKRFVEVFGQHMSTESGWASSNLMVTGFLSPEELRELRDFLAEIVKRSIRLGEGTNFRVTSLGPIYSIKDWDALPEGQVVIAMRSNQQEGIDLEGLDMLGQDGRRWPLFCLWK